MALGHIPTLIGMPSLFWTQPLQKGTAPSHPIFQIPGVTTRMVRHDSLHVLFTRGLYGHILGSILHYLCYYNLPGQTQSVQPSDRLSIIFQEIQRQYTLQKVACRLTNLHLKMFCKNPKSPWVHWAHLGAKGGECKHLAPCLLPVLKDLLDNSKEEHPHLVACLESMVQLNEILDSCDLFLKDAEFDAFFGLAKGFVEEYSWLHGHFEEQGRPLFHIVNKSHTFLHWSWEAYFINPRAHTCWKGEDLLAKWQNWAIQYPLESEQQDYPRSWWQSIKFCYTSCIKFCYTSCIPESLQHSTSWKMMVPDLAKGLPTHPCKRF